MNKPTSAHPFWGDRNRREIWKRHTKRTDEQSKQLRAYLRTVSGEPDFRQGLQENIEIAQARKLAQEILCVRRKVQSDFQHVEECRKESKNSDSDKQDLAKKTLPHLEAGMKENLMRLETMKEGVKSQMKELCDISRKILLDALNSPLKGENN